jgi:menaquinol-cytochrome c reductase cytochrome b/c subunit
MVEIPEHLRKRAEEARAKAEAARGGGDGEADAGGDAGGDSGIPSELLERSKAARARAAGGDAETAPASGGGGGTAVATAPAAATPTGPGGHTQRLLTVVKAGSIQDVKATPVDKVHTWPHLLLIEFVAALGVTAFLLFFSFFVNAPLLELANPNKTPNPSKAPWYFLGLQELLTMFHPMIAGVTIPTIGLLGFMMAPYIDRNPSQKPEDRKFAISLWTVTLMFWGVLVIIGSFFRGPGQNFVFPWNEGIFFDL